MVSGAAKLYNTTRKVLPLAASMQEGFSAVSAFRAGRGPPYSYISEVFFTLHDGHVISSRLEYCNLWVTCKYETSVHEEVCARLQQ